MTYYYDQELAAISPASRQVVWTVKVGRQPSGLAVLGNKVWVSNYAGDTLTRVDIVGGEVDATFDTTAGPSDVGGSGFGRCGSRTSTPVG